ncbi:MAG TPA: succinylglutamate desuccinylase/aspartoacylase family protein [Symbiobacteriaceae bacterium]|nr:succinylglutamate desuccinylase/aspartoacylase family protein [Symbiobacteriaceae bacterium]
MHRRVNIEAYHPHELEFHTFGCAAHGPKVLITAGIHGGEATGIYAAKKLIRWLEGRELSGQVTVLPVGNPGGFRRGTRSGPFDDLDMNRVFPGSPTGSPTERLAHAIWEEAEQSDFIVDLHCCGLFGSDYTLALHSEFSQAAELAAKLDIPVVIESSGTRSQLFVEASHKGIPAVIIELAGGQFGADGGIVNRKSGENAYLAVSNLLIRLGLVEGEAPPAAPVFYGKLQEVKVDGQGLWTPAVAPGETLTQGQVLGQFSKQDVLSPVTGVTTSVRPCSFRFPGDSVCMVAPLQEA